MQVKRNLFKVMSNARAMAYFERFKKGRYRGKSTWGKVWYFIWSEDSIESWLINIALAFILIKYIIYPGLGFVLATSHPIVAVVSGSMQHHHLGEGMSSCGTSMSWSSDFDTYWKECGDWYAERNISKQDFEGFPMHNGFNKGDIMVLLGRNPEEIGVGDIIVFQGPRPDPIIHRVVGKRTENGIILATKGDHNSNQLQFERMIMPEQIIGKAFIRVPYLGYVKIAAVEFICLFDDFDFCIKS
ncbi:signal peptidase I [Candidatus Woesearchaeota archaeon]|nr:signal peptidase I [Candidatus Woesearchaeota archaeon]